MYYIYKDNFRVHRCDALWKVQEYLSYNKGVYEVSQTMRV